MNIKFDIPLFSFKLSTKRSTENDPISQSTIEKCIRIALNALERKRDRDGNALILHSLMVGSMGNTDAEKCVGFLHDVVEDSEWSFEELLEEDIPTEIIDVLRLCTHEKDIGYYDYIQRIIDSGNETALNVKLNDLHHNIARGKAYGYSELVEKYEKALGLIERALDKNKV